MAKRFFVLTLLGLLFLPLTSFAITVGPVKLEYSVDPGDTVSGELFIQNEESQARTLYPVFEKFTEEEGVKKFTREESDLSTWFKAQSLISLKPGQQARIPFSIEVPEDASPGGHFAVIWWSTAPADFEGQEQVSIVTRAGILVYVTVSGDIKEEGGIESFSTSGNKKLLTQLPIVFNIIFKNTGNVHLKPQGNTLIKNVFGKTKDSLSINQFGLNILPQTRKSFQEKWQPKSLAFGFLKAELNLNFGESKKSSTQSIWFFVFNWKAFGTTVLILIVLVLAPFVLKKYNQWIISKALGKR